MKRVVSLYLPTWPTDRLRRRLGDAAPSPETPTVLIGRGERRRAVLAVDQAARRLGLHPGMPATQARALCGDLSVHDADPEGDAQALDDLAVWALRRYTPIAAADPPDGLMLDVSGAGHLFGGEKALLTDLVGRLARVGISARACVAESPGAAHAFAHFGGQAVFVAGRDAGALLGELPLQALRIEPALTDALKTLGLERVIDVEARPRGPLVLRFGTELIQRLDQAYARVEEPIIPVRAPETVSARRVFVEPISAPETLARHTLKLTQALCRALEAKGLGARVVDLGLQRVDGRLEAVRARLARPSLEAKHLARLLCEKLDTVDPGFGVEAMTLLASSAEPLAPKTAPVLGERAIPEVANLVDTLSNRVGARRIYRIQPTQSDVPERSTRKVGPIAPPGDGAWPALWPRPPRLLAPPERIETVALLPDHPPVSFTWRGVRRRVRRADGPERIFGEWWRRDAERDAVRDYFQIEDEAGERFWVFRRGDGETPAAGDLSWWLHGLFG